MKLWNIMLYVTDDVSQHFVPLQMKVDCINDFIELQRLRLSKKVTRRFIGVRAMLFIQCRTIDRLFKIFFFRLTIQIRQPIYPLYRRGT
jgi:hypothetical protein